MKQQITSFTSYELNPREELEGCSFNMIQLAKIQNRLSTAAHLKMNLVCEPEQEAAFFREHAYYTGQIFVLQQMLDDSEQAIRQLSQPNFEV